MADEQREQEQVKDQQQEQPARDEAAQAQEAQAKDKAEEAQQSKGRDLEAEVEELQVRLAHANEQVLRAQADAQNAMRRAERDVEKAHKFGQERLITDLLAVVDNLERALAAVPEGAEESVKALAEGVELTLKSLRDSLKNRQVEEVNPEGEPFDPELHQAMSVVESRDAEPNTVLQVFQKGYTLHGRLVRPAMVVVSKAAAE